MTEGVTNFVLMRLRGWGRGAGLWGAQVQTGLLLPYPQQLANHKGRVNLLQKIKWNDFSQRVRGKQGRTLTLNHHSLSAFPWGHCCYMLPVNSGQITPYNLPQSKERNINVHEKGVSSSFWQFFKCDSSMLQWACGKLVKALITSFHFCFL